MARRIDDKTISYKEKKTKGILDRVTATLSANHSGVMTKILNRYAKIDRLIKQLNESKNNLNEEIRNRMGDLFDAEDEVITRVVETVSMVVTLSKPTPETTSEISTFDAEGYIEELYNVFPELEEQLNILKEKYTVIESVTTEAKPSRLMAPKYKTAKLTESEDLDNKIEEYSHLVGQVIMKNLRPIDRKLAEIKRGIKGR